MDSIFGMLGFKPGTPAGVLDGIFREVMLPMIASGTIGEHAGNMALMAETLSYEVLIKATETEDAFKSYYAMMQAPLWGIGRAHVSDGFESTPEPQPVVGFFLPGNAILAHTEQLITYLRALKQSPNQPMPIRPIVYVATPEPGELKRVITEELGFPVVCVGGLLPLAMLAKLREVCARDRAAALVFVSTPVNMITAVAMRVAPATIWWSMKWYSLAVPSLTARMTPRRGDTVQLGGYEWKCGHVCLPDLVNVKATGARAKLRAQWKITDDQIVLGFFGREEKLSPAYGEAIAAVLEANEKAVFVYTGRGRRMPEFEEKLKHVVHRCRFIGWVDVSVCVWAIDIYADSFPMGSGHTAFAAMQAGVPVVTLRTPENDQNSAGAHFQELVEGPQSVAAWSILSMGVVQTPQGEWGAGIAHPFMADLGNYHYVLCQLIQDKAYRDSFGAQQQKFVRTFLMEAELYAAKTTGIILDAIAGQAGIPVTALAPPANILAHDEATATEDPPQEAALGAGTPGAGPDRYCGELPEGCGEGSAPEPDGPAGDRNPEAGDP